MGNVQQTKEKLLSLLSRVSFKHYAVVFTPPPPSPQPKSVWKIAVFSYWSFTVANCEHECVCV